MRVNLSDFTRVDNLKLHSGEDRLFISVVSGDCEYFGKVKAHTKCTKLYEILLSELTGLASL